MDLNYVKKLIKLLSTSSIDEIEIEEDGKRVRVARNTNNRPQAAIPPQGPATSAIVSQQPTPAALPQQPASVSPEAPAVTEKKYHEITCPIVGTFYRAPAPDADPYVEVGQVVQPATVLCIIEAMKLMNEIESDIAGRIVKIHVENGQPVEYNQVLFSIEPMS